MDMTESKIEQFFKNLLEKISGEYREKSRKTEIQRKRIQLLEEAVEGDQYETIELFFELIQKKNYSLNDRNRA